MNSNIPNCFVHVDADERENGGITGVGSFIVRRILETLHHLSFCNMSAPLRLLLLARDPSARVQSARAELEEILVGCDGLQVVGVATDDDPEMDQSDVDLAVVLGGDGAILRACRSFGRQQIPLLGVNSRTVGLPGRLDAGEHSPESRSTPGS